MASLHVTAPLTRNATVPLQQTRSQSVDYLTTVNQFLATGWTANLDRYGRIYYTCHATQTTQWIPPTENWDAGEWRLPYGWECAADPQGRIYYINHIDKFTTYDDPRLAGGDDDSDQDLFPLPRDVVLHRDPTIGFGFVAGSEKPVIVRFVNEDGPSAGKLLPSDLILRINGEDVEKAPRDHVIELVRSCKDSVTLTVCQPQSDNASRKSAFLSAAKKAKLKSKPSRVRFADGVVINGTGSIVDVGDPEAIPSPFIPNVLKVFLENGQTKSFKYDSKTTVKDVMNSLKEKLSIKAVEHFALVVEHVKSFKKNQLKLLNPEDTIAKIAARPGAQHLRCLFRVMFVPKDAFELLNRDPVAFDYFYMQCCNDVIDERFATELRCDVALRLAALHMQQHGLSNNIAAKVSVKRVEKDCGLERFIPPSILEAMKHKELRRLLSHLIKVNNQQLCTPGQKRLSESQVKVHYLKILSELPTFGGRCFNVTIPETKNDGLILVSPKFGVSQISGTKTGSPVMLTELESISEVVIAEIPDAFHSIELHVKPPLHERFAFETENGDDLDDMVQLLNGYSKLFLGVSLRILVVDDTKDDNKSPGEPPSYYGHHVVYSMPWSYPAELKSIIIQLNDDSVKNSYEHYADFSQTPPLPEPSATHATEVAMSPVRETVRSLTGTVVMRRSSAESTNSSPTHVEVNLSVTNTSSSLEAPPPPPDVVKNMRFIDDSTSSELDTPVAERALKRALPDYNVWEHDVVRLQRPHANPEKLFGETMITNDLTEEPDLVKRTLSQAGSTAELAAQLSSFHTPSTPTDATRIWHQKMDLASDSEETDSVSTTPTDSPIHRVSGHNNNNAVNRGLVHHRVANPPSSLFRSGSSFGLHSPDDVGKFNDGIHVYVDNIAEMEMNCADNNDHRQSVGSLYLDPDIIDLCQIPIPEENETMMYDEIDVPPTPFRDPLIPFPGCGNGNGNGNGSEFRPLPDIEEDPSSSLPVSARSTKDARNTGDISEKSAVSLDEALCELNSFISAMTIPDPEDEHPHLHRVTSEDIRLLVIPPPPSHSPARQSSTETLHHVSRDIEITNTNGSPRSSDTETPLRKPPLPPKPKIIPPPPPPRNKSLERQRNQPNRENSKSTSHPEENSIVPSLVSPRMYQRQMGPGKGDIENSSAFKNCVAEINAQLTEIATRKGNASSESDLISTTPSASEESTPVMWRKNPVLNCRTNRKPPIVGGVHPNATLPFAAMTKQTSSQIKNRYRSSRPPPREKLRKRLAAVRAQQAETQDSNMTNENGEDDDDDDEPYSSYQHEPVKTAVSGPSGVTRVDIQSNSLPHQHNSHNHYETDADVLERINQIVSEIDWTLDSIRRTNIVRPHLTNMKLAREELISEARRFVTASKTFVKSATVVLSSPSNEPLPVLPEMEGTGSTPRGSLGRPTSLTGNTHHPHPLFHESLVRCTDLIGMMFHSATLVARYSATVPEASKLVEGILLVALSFRSTMQVAVRPSASVGHLSDSHSLHDPAVKLLMSEATKLAASLTSLMKTIRSLENSQNGPASQFVAEERQVKS